VPEEAVDETAKVASFGGDGTADVEISEETASVADTSMATDILADLDVLKREVEAARGQYGQPGG
jgi:hypothetical protein